MVAMRLLPLVIAAAWKVNGGPVDGAIAVAVASAASGIITAGNDSLLHNNDNNNIHIPDAHQQLDGDHHRYRRHYRHRHLDGEGVDAAASGIAEEDTGAMFGEQEDTCFMASDEMMNASSELDAAEEVYTSTMATDFAGDHNLDVDAFDGAQMPDMSIGFPEDAETTFRQACQEAGGYWSAVEKELFFCHEEGMPDDDMTAIWIHGMGNCLANTDECQALDPILLLEDVWVSMGLNCRLAQDGETLPPMSDESMEMNEEEIMNETETFLSPDDAMCMDATGNLVRNDDSFQAAAAAYEDSSEINLDDAENSEMTMGYSSEAAAVMQTACNDAGGYWSIIESEDFTCDFMGIQQSLNVYNFGTCLASTDECRAMDIVHLLESVWDVMDLTCWDANDDAPELDGLNPSDDDLMCLSDSEDLAMDATELADASSTYADTMDVTQDENSGDMELGFPDDAVAALKDACDAAGGFFSLVVTQDFVCTMADLSINVAVNNMGDCLANTVECQNMDPIQLLESVWDSLSLECVVADEDSNDGDEDGETGTGEGTGTEDGGDDQSGGTGNDTDEDDGGDSEGGDATSGSTGEEENEGGDEGQDETGSEGDNPDDNGTDKEESGSGSGGEANNDPNGLTPADASCMEASMSLIQGSDVLSAAEEKYSKSMELEDPTKIGYSSQAANTMKSVCEDQGGYWSGLASQDVTCDMNGRMRRVNVYNFGNCVASTEECKEMDPLVLVKGFFWEILNSRCWKSEEHGSGGSGGGSGEDVGDGPPTTGSGHHTGGGMPNLGGSTTSASATGTDDDGATPLIPAVVALCALVVIGFGVFYWRRQSTGRERISRRAYEMTDVSDLRFDSLT